MFHPSVRFLESDQSFVSAAPPVRTIGLSAPLITSTTHVPLNYLVQPLLSAPLIGLSAYRSVTPPRWWLSPYMAYFLFLNGNPVQNCYHHKIYMQREMLMKSHWSRGCSHLNGTNYHLSKHRFSKLLWSSPGNKYTEHWLRRNWRIFIGQETAVTYYSCNFGSRGSHVQNYNLSLGANAKNQLRQYIDDYSLKEGLKLLINVSCSALMADLMESVVIIPRK